MSRAALLALAAIGLAGLAGCSHSCVPYGWYRARAVAPLTRPPGAPKMAHDPTYDIPGGSPGHAPTRDEACLVQPPNAIEPGPAHAAPAAATAGHGS